MRHSATKAVTRVRVLAAAIGLKIDKIPAADETLPVVAQAEATLRGCADELAKALDAFDGAKRAKREPSE